MQRSTKAALLSALVFPGAGQLFLRRYGRACLFLLPTLGAVYFFVDAILEPAMAIAMQVVNGDIALDPIAIEARLHQDGQANSPLVNLAVMVMLACWIGAIVDAWLGGRAAPPPAP